jgi:DNA-binding GntR family transcriptional regulator
VDYLEPREIGKQGGSAGAYTRLRDQIISCRLAPGARVTEALLAAEFGLGKTPVREALLRLRNDGLVQVMPRHGYRITTITLRDVQEICALRLILEAAAARLAAGRMDADELWRLDQQCQLEVMPGDHEGIAALLRANTGFHLAIARASANRHLAAITETILARMERLFHLTLTMQQRSDEISHDHRDLIEALIAGDGEEASRLMTVRLQASQRKVTAALLSSPQLLSVNIAPLPLDGGATRPELTLVPPDGEPGGHPIDIGAALSRLDYTT